MVTIVAAVIRHAVMKLPVMELHVVKTAAMAYAGKLAVQEPAVKQTVMVFVKMNVTSQPAMPAVKELAMKTAVKIPAPSPAVKVTVIR